MTKILGISTQPAPFRYESDELLQFMEHYIADDIDLRKLKFIWRESGIKTKYSALEDFKLTAKPQLFNNGAALPSTAERLEAFERIAPKMAEQVALDVLASAGMDSSEIGAVIAVSCTGLFAPGLEIELANRLGLSSNVQRHGVNFMGCYAAFHGLRLADLICKVNPKAKVLLVCVELCSLHFRRDSSNDNLLSTVLFSDGAAAVLLGGAETKATGKAEISRFHSVLIPEGKEDMSWRIGNNGFEMVLGRDVPKHILNNIAEAYAQTLGQSGWQADEVDGFAIHPGGKNILSAFASALEVDVDRLHESFSVLENYGNMSSCSVLFVIEQILSQSKPDRQIYSAAFGPGLTVESALIRTL